MNILSPHHDIVQLAVYYFMKTLILLWNVVKIYLPFLFFIKQIIWNIDVTFSSYPTKNVWCKNHMENVWYNGQRESTFPPHKLET